MEAAASLRISSLSPPAPAVSRHYIYPLHLAAKCRFHISREQLLWTMKRHPSRSKFCKLRSRTVRAVDASFDGRTEDMRGSPAVFQRINVRDPYKRLGISRDASEEEIQEARSFLANQYAEHERSRESIEAAYDKIIMESFRARKKSKINLKSNLKKKVAESPPWVRNVANMFEIPSTQVILQRAVLFGLLGVWSVMNPTEGGPAFQVAVSLAGCIYLLNDRLKSIGRAFILGFGGLVVGWMFGSFLVPVIPPSIIPWTWSLELITALISYVFLWFSCTFLK